MAAITTKKGTGSDDVLTISKNGLNYVTGLEGDDTYVINNIKKSWTIVDDTVKNYEDMEDIFDYLNFEVSPVSDGGGYDTVQINNVNANDLILFFDVGLYDDVDSTLSIVHKSSMDSVISQMKNLMNKGKLPSSGCVEMDYYFDGEDNRIERIQVSKGGITKELDVDSYIDSVSEKVREVLDRYGYDTAMEMLFSRASKKQINALKDCYKTPIDLIIYGTDNKNDNIYAEAGSDTIIFNADSGDDTVYNATSADKLYFNGDVTVSFLEKNGNNLYLYYGEDNKVTLYNYYKAKPENRLDYFDDEDGEHYISSQTINVKGSGKIYGTEGNDIIKGSAKADTIYGKGGDDNIYGGLGNDIIYSQSQAGDTVLLAGEEGNDKLYAGTGEDIFCFGKATNEGKDTIYNANSDDKLRFANIKFEDLKFTKSGNNLVITIADMNNLSEDAQAVYKNFQVTLSNYFKSNDKLDTIEFVDGSGNIIDTALISGAKFYLSGSGKISATDYDEIITGSKKADKITTGAGNDVITAGMGNDTITLGAGSKTLNFNNGDGNDTIYVNGSDSVKINLDSCKSIDYIKGQGKTADDLYIERKYLDAKGKVKTETITVKDYFKGSPNISVVSDGKTQDLSDVIFTIKGNEKKGGELKGTEGNEVLRGTDKVDTIYANGGNDIIRAGKGNDIIHAENTTCTINLDELDGVDTVYADSSSNITLNYIGTEEEIRFFKSAENESDLVITRGLDFKNDIVVIKNYYDLSYGDRPAISYQFNGKLDDVHTVDEVFLKDLKAYYYPDKDNKGLMYTIDENENIISLSKSMLFESPNDTNDIYIVNNARNYTSITDYQGEDTLQVNNITEDKLKMFFDVSKDKGLNDYNSQNLYLFDSKDATLANLTKCLTSANPTAKGIKIEDYFNTGKIENMMAADANGDNAKEIDAQTKTYVIAREVQKYLQELAGKGKKYNSAAEVLLYERDSKIKNNLLNLYLKTDVEKIMAEGYTFDYKHNLITNGSTLTGSDSDDKFILNDNRELRINYNNLTFNGGAGNDEYQINVANVGNGYDPTIDSLNIVDTSGADTYIIGPNDSFAQDAQYGISITDYEGNDTYVLSTYLAYDGMTATAPKRTIIDDKAGNNTLSLVGDKTNVGVRFSVTLNDGGYTIGDDLIIVNSQMTFYDEQFAGTYFNERGICVKDYFENDNMSINLNGKTLNRDYLDNIASDVAGWLSDNGFTSTTNLGNGGYDERELLACFNQSNLWQDTTPETTIN